MENTREFEVYFRLDDDGPVYFARASSPEREGPAAAVTYADGEIALVVGGVTSPVSWIKVGGAPSGNSEQRGAGSPTSTSLGRCQG